MGLNVGNVPVKQVYVGSTPVTAVYVGAEKIWPTTEVHEVSVIDVWGTGAVHPLVTVTVPTGQTWQVRIQGTVTAANSFYSSAHFRIGSSTSQSFTDGEVDFSGTITSSDSAVQMVTGGRNSSRASSFTGTVTIEK